jgi:hypothetical protein
MSTPSFASVSAFAEDGATGAARDTSFDPRRFY